MEISYAGSKRCRVRPHPNQNPKSKIQTPKSKIQNPNSKIQNPKSKRRRLGPPQKERILNWSKIQNPKSKLQNPKSKIQDPKSKIQNPKSKLQTPNSKLQTPKSKLQNPKSKRPVWSLDFGFWTWSGREWRRWLCSKWWCMAVLATRIWPSWRRTSLQPKGSRLDSPRTRPKLGTDFRRRGFAGNRAPISGPASWRSEPNFRRNCGPGWRWHHAVRERKGCQHHAASTMCAYARDVRVA